MRHSLLASILLFGCASGEAVDGSTPVSGSGSGFDVDGGVSCPAGTATILTGRAVSPAKSSPDPIFNALVYVPAGELEPFEKGVSCAKCGTVEGGTKFKVATLTAGDGTFRLEGVPAGKNVPLVVQIGRWRRKVVLPEVKACATTELPTDLTRLPRNHDEGDIPLTAIVSGRADPIECVLRKMGVDDSEFTGLGKDGLPITPGRIHFFRSILGPDMKTGTLKGESLYQRLDWMKQFDQILLPCEGDANTEDKEGDAMKNLVAYVNAGGRVLTTHYGYTWLRNSSDPGWKNLAEWSPVSERKNDLPATIAMTFPKGRAMAEWLQVVGATTEPGKLTLQEANIDVVGRPAGQLWIDTASPVSAQHFTFNAPLEKPPAEQCGKVIYSDFHVVGFADDFSYIEFPNECTDGPLTAQERVMEFMLFDLASCVQPETEAPKPPR